MIDHAPIKRPSGKPRKPGLSYYCELHRMHLFSQNGRVNEKCGTCGRTAQQCLDIGPNQTLVGFRHTSRRNKPLIIRNQLTKIFQSTIEVRPPCLIVESGHLELGQCHVEALPGRTPGPLIILGNISSTVNGYGSYLAGGTHAVAHGSRLSIERRRDISS